eukprot:1177724-Prorocentrum_minimum.AAC.6
MQALLGEMLAEGYGCVKDPEAAALVSSRISYLPASWALDHQPHTYAKYLHCEEELNASNVTIRIAYFYCSRLRVRLCVCLEVGRTAAVPILPAHAFGMAKTVTAYFITWLDGRELITAEVCELLNYLKNGRKRPQREYNIIWKGHIHLLAMSIASNEK